MPKIITRKAALAKGLTRYYTGRRCPAGHDAERTVSDRKCVVCNLVRYRSPRGRRKLAERQQRYRESPKGRDTRWQWRQTPFAHDAEWQANNSPRGRDNQWRYANSPKGHHRTFRQQLKRAKLDFAI